LIPRIRLLMLSPNLWHRMIFNIIVASCEASDLHKLPKWGSVTLWETLVLIYRYLRVSPGTTQKWMLHDSIRYQNTRSRDPITLLSMDIGVETL
jgi:hypothetical protein